MGYELGLRDGVTTALDLEMGAKAGTSRTSTRLVKGRLKRTSVLRAATSSCGSSFSMASQRRTAWRASRSERGRTGLAKRCPWKKETRFFNTLMRACGAVGWESVPPLATCVMV